MDEGDIEPTDRTLAPEPWRINRRALLKAAVLGGASTAAISLPIVEGLTSDVASAEPTPPQVAGLSPIAGKRPAIGRKLGSQAFSYRITLGYDFIPLDSTVTANYAGNYAARAQLSGTPALWTAPLYLPDGAILLGVDFIVMVNNGTPAAVYLNDLVGVQASATVSGPSTSFQNVLITPSSPITVDNSQNAYFLGWVPGTATSQHQLLGGQVIFTNEDRLIKFPNPRRIYDGYVNPTAPGTYGPIDATVKSGGTASGVPPGAQAAFCAVQSFSAGVMTLYPDGAADPGIANWSGTANGPLNLMYMLVPLSTAGKFWIHTYFAGQKFIDAWGYIL